MSKSSKFYAYRYFVIPNNQIAMFAEYKAEEKNNLIKDIFNKLKKVNRIEHILNNRKNILYATHKFSDDLYLCKFAIEHYITKHEETEDDIKNVKDQDFPYIYILVDLKRQIILFEKNTNVIQKMSTTKNKFENWIKKEINDYDFSFKLEKIVYEYEFWEYVKKSDNIYELNLNLNSPNLFEGLNKANKLLKKINGLFNNTETDVTLENEDGDLVVEKENVGGFIKYTSAGGGSWNLTADYEGKKQTFKSKNDENAKTCELPKDIEEKISDDLKRQINREIMKIEDIIDVDN